jgi:hypothetical protein
MPVRFSLQCRFRDGSVTHRSCGFRRKRHPSSTEMLPARPALPAAARLVARRVQQDREPTSTLYSQEIVTRSAWQPVLVGGDD